MSTTEDEVRAQLRTDRINTVNAEWRALQEWRKGGEVGERPATPNVDLIQDEAFKPIRLNVATDKQPRSKAVREAKAAVMLCVDGEPVGDSINCLSEMGQRMMTPRMKVADFKAWLTSKNVDYTGVGWSVVLPSGKTLSRINRGDAPLVEPTTIDEAPLASSGHVIVEESAESKPKRQRPSRSKVAVAERAAAKSGETAPKLQPRKANKPVVGIKAPASRRKAS